MAEELTRLRLHLDQVRSAVDASEPSGKKLDFLAQEIVREINTIGSKATDHLISREVVKMKAELEKVREQVQNVE